MNNLYAQVPGRLYPIQLFYRPVTIEDIRYKNDRFNPSPYIQIMQLVDQKYPGKYLPFARTSIFDHIMSTGIFSERERRLVNIFKRDE